ncbi:hypothetical protein B9Z55_022906 [Caenorhabditis nigoni]|uniref:histone acetyltransferase n=1 Tax=Caenorhabditis nigoni TaxID=1611254 RepID=A0A2G5SMU4_9PELO|nr:hypothetical protein B9Z55_022906 [Caenorhabditis nigoni]
MHGEDRIAEKGQSRSATMMEEKLNAIMKEQQCRISVRTVSTKSVASKHYSDVFEQKYGQEICFKTRTIAAFQRQDGVDQVFFMMFVQEYQDLADQKSWFVIDYLDSVKYLETDLRKRIYSEILLSYFEFARSLGLLNGYIWSDPPVKGDDSVFNIHPEDQQYLEIDKVIDWYRRVLDKGVREKRIKKYQDFGELIFLFKYLNKLLCKEIQLFIFYIFSRYIRE